ncbi:MAG: AIM24 family protein [Coriobacteriia bacterium]|nr:AIM24 family protein [Coriobacteriia bacterium]
MSDSVSPGVALRLGEFVNAHAQKDTGGTWQLESSKTLEVHLSGNRVFTKVGAMIGYYGDIKFTRAGAGGATKWLKSAMSGEGGAMTEAAGSGILYCADQGKQISILYLDNETLFVNGQDCLAYSETIGWDIVVTGGAGFMAGGLFSLKLTGTGYVAITTHGKPLVLGVGPGQPLFTDPNATVAWSAGLQTTVKTDVNLKTLTGRGSGETFQMRFDGTGFVVLQPFEEIVVATNG